MDCEIKEDFTDQLSSWTFEKNLYFKLGTISEISLMDTVWSAGKGFAWSELFWKVLLCSFRPKVRHFPETHACQDRYSRVQKKRRDRSFSCNWRPHPYFYGYLQWRDNVATISSRRISCQPRTPLISHFYTPSSRLTHARAITAPQGLLTIMRTSERSWRSNSFKGQTPTKVRDNYWLKKRFLILTLIQLRSKVSGHAWRWSVRRCVATTWCATSKAPASAASKSAAVSCNPTCMSTSKPSNQSRSSKTPSTAQHWVSTFCATRPNADIDF